MRIAFVILCVASLNFAASAHAWHGFFKHRGVPVTKSDYTSATAGSTCASCGNSGITSSFSEANGTAFGTTATLPMRPYSYYAAPNGDARGYFGYGEDQFPYYGRAYGHPYDPWTWPYMSYGYQNSLNRYYEPPVR